MEWEREKLEKALAFAYLVGYAASCDNDAMLGKRLREKISEVAAKIDADES